MGTKVASPGLRRTCSFSHPAPVQCPQIRRRSEGLPTDNPPVLAQAPGDPAEQARKRRQGKSDALGSVRIARETQAEPGIPRAFKRAEGDAGPDETTELIALWHKARVSLLKSRRGPRVYGYTISLT